MNSDGVDGESSTMATVNVASPPPRHLSNLERAAGLSSPALGVERVKSKGKGKGKGKLEPSEAVREQFDNPKVLDFDNKRSYFQRQLHKRKDSHVHREHYGTLQINVRRQFVFEDSWHSLMRRTGDEIKNGKMSIRFYDEEGVDAGGVAREWFQVLARQMFNPNYALWSEYQLVQEDFACFELTYMFLLPSFFVNSPSSLVPHSVITDYLAPCASDRLTYTPNRSSWINPEHLSLFKFIGRIIGKAIYDGRLLDAYFTRSMYKHILGRPVDYRDLESIDPEYYNSLVWMLENDITDVIEQTFSVEADDFGQTKIIDLIPNGRNLMVTQENKIDYVKHIAEQKLTKAIQDQIDAFLGGFYEIVPKQLIQLFSDSELELLISGLPDIDVDEWRANSTYHNISATSNSVTWFWRAVRSLDQTERAKLLQFCTGSSRVPLEGFQALQGVQGNTKFTIVAAHTENVLPTAHTCFNQIDLPNYASYEDLRKMLVLAVTEGSVGFAFA
ncbi:MAG: hypothetical protein CYPHOPRED_001043 [Cyphobasidiales sp. Tagirdzhanova-0007]|nr:MAG: hypothetical protein CYPHOPRED_001043 [Cyphobasidiales sp. Tagirdzhanova-0007]